MRISYSWRMEALDLVNTTPLFLLIPQMALSRRVVFQHTATGMSQYPSGSMLRHLMTL